MLKLALSQPAHASVSVSQPEPGLVCVRRFGHVWFHAEAHARQLEHLQAPMRSRRPAWHLHGRARYMPSCLAQAHRGAPIRCMPFGQTEFHHLPHLLTAEQPECTAVSIPVPSLPPMAHPRLLCPFLSLSASYGPPKVAVSTPVPLCLL